jgi:hypothetical protein
MYQSILAIPHAIYQKGIFPTPQLKTILSLIAMAKVAVNKNKTLHQQTGLEFKE